MREVLHELHHHWSFAALDIKEALHAQQIRPAQLHQGIHRSRKHGPWHWFVVSEHKAADAVAMRGLRDEGIALIACRLGQAAGVYLAIDGFMNLGAWIECTQLSAQRRACAFPRNIGFGDDQTIGKNSLLACFG